MNDLFAFGSNGSLVGLAMIVDEHGTYLCAALSPVMLLAKSSFTRGQAQQLRTPKASSRLGTARARPQAHRAAPGSKRRLISMISR